jgi:hypothetical protein
MPVQDGGGKAANGKPMSVLFLRKPKKIGLVQSRVAARESDHFCPSHPGAMQRKSLTAYLNIACENALRTHSATPSTQRI